MLGGTMKQIKSQCWFKKELDERLFVNPSDYSNHYKKMIRQEYKNLRYRGFPVIRLSFSHKIGKQHCESYYLWEKNRKDFMCWYTKQKFKIKNKGEMNVLINYTLSPKDYYEANSCCHRGV